MSARDVRRMELFHLLRLMEAEHPKSPRLGEAGPARQEAIRLRPNSSLSFPTREVLAVEHVEEPVARLRVTTNLPGLYGSGTPLPLSYAHQVLKEENNHPQLRGFLDILHHRLFSLWYRVWKRNHPEQSFLPDGSDRLTRCLLQMIGVAPDTPEEELGTTPLRLLGYLGWLVIRTRPLRGLEVLLIEELGLPLRIEQCPPRMRVLPKALWCRLSSDPQRGGSLGSNVVIGSRRVDRLGSLTLHIGPVDYDTLLALWPGGRLGRRLTALSRFYLRQALDLSLRVLVPAEQVPRVQLGQSRIGQPVSMGVPRQDPVVFLREISLADTMPHGAHAAACP